MAQNRVHTIIASHRAAGEMVPGPEIDLRIDQALTQDATGTLAARPFEAMRVPRIRTRRSVTYIDDTMVRICHREMAGQCPVRVLSPVTAHIFGWEEERCWREIS